MGAGLCLPLLVLAAGATGIIPSAPPAHGPLTARSAIRRCIGPCVLPGRVCSSYRLCASGPTWLSILPRHGRRPSSIPRVASARFSRHGRRHRGRDLHACPDTRASILRCLDQSASTTHVARALAISTGAVGDHLSILYRAGLVTKASPGKSVLYSRTDLGDTLVREVGGR